MSKFDDFDESRPEFSGFNAFYRDKIFPELIAKDMIRRQKVNNFYKWGAIIGAIIGLGIIGLAMRGHISFAFFAGFGAVAGVTALGAKMLGGVKGETKQLLVGNICNFVGWHFQTKGFQPIPLEPFRRFGLLPKSSDRERFEDKIEGQAHGAQFRLHEAHLERENHSDKGPEYTTQFRGVLIKMEFPRKKFAGTTIVLRDKGIFNRKQKSGLKRVGLVDPVFEKAFEAYGDDQVEARYLLTPDFMQQLVDLESLFEGKALRAMFRDGALDIVFEAPNQFESGSMFKPLTDPDRTHKLLSEIGAIFDIIDGVLKPSAPRPRNPYA